MRQGTPYSSYGGFLKHAMTTRGVTVLGLAAALGLDHSTVVDWRRGGRLPGVGNAKALSEYLDWDSLLERCVELRTLTCLTCDKQFIRDNKGGRLRKYCSSRCAQNGATRRTRYGEEVPPRVYAQVQRTRHARSLKPSPTSAVAANGTGSARMRRASCASGRRCRWRRCR